MRKIEIRGQRRRTAQGAVTGGLAGGLAGGLVGALGASTTATGCVVMASMVQADPDPCVDDASQFVVIGVVIGAAVGGGVGALIGSKPREGWVPVELPSTKPLVAVHPTGRFAVGLTFPVRR